MQTAAVFLSLLLLPALTGFSQHYTATNGSPYFSSLQVSSNPAAIAHAPNPWELAVFGIQFTTISNTIRGHNFPFYLAPGNAFTVANGNYRRRADINYNLHLLNFRCALNISSGIAFGLNVRGYMQSATSRVNYTDQVKGPLSFLTLNVNNRVLDVQAQASSWLEVYGAYAKTFVNNEAAKLSGGATLKVSKGLGAFFAQAGDVGVASSVEDGREVYKVVNGHARYGYSSNFGNTEQIKAGNLFSGGQTSAAIDLGVEYVIKTQSVSSVYDDPEDEAEYEWKIGFSLLDLGAHRFTYGQGSREVSTLRDDVTSSVLQEKFVKVESLERFNDSLATIVQQADRLSGSFRVIDPVRAVVNIDRPVGGHFFVNGELSLNLVPRSMQTVAVRESNLLTVTPRWETKRLGFFAPVQVTQHGNVWLGAALKAGPLLLGTHNLLNLFSSNGYLSGGAYLAIIIRPSHRKKEPHNRQYDCPPY